MDDLMQELNAIQSASNISCDYRKTIALLRALKAGTLSLDNVTMTDDGWNVAEVEPPDEPNPIFVEPAYGCRPEEPEPPGVAVADAEDVPPPPDPGRME